MADLATVRALLHEALDMLDEMEAWVSAVHVSSAISKLPKDGEATEMRKAPIALGTPEADMPGTREIGPQEQLLN